MTRKKYEFEWGEKEAAAFEEAKMAIQTALDLWPMKEDPLEIHVTVRDQYANGSLQQQQEGKWVPLGFRSRKLPNAGESYTPFEQQLLAAYWTLMEMEQLTVGRDVLLRPGIPIMNWILSAPASH